MRKRMTLMISLLVFIFGALFLYKMVGYFFMQKFFNQTEAPPVTISAEAAKEEFWQPILSAVGSLEAEKGVDLSSEVGGIVDSINFKSGERVEKDTLLVKLIDSVEHAQLIENQAQLQLAKLNFDRQQSLLKNKATSKSSVDEAKALLTQRQAQVDKIQAMLDQKHITAPFAGRLGIRQINLGQFLSPGTFIVTLQSIDPLLARFSLPEQYINQVHAGQKVEATVSAFPKKTFWGQLTAINSKIDENTRNFTLEATFPNSKQELHPGMFAQIKVLMGDKQKVITVPQTAIAYSLYGDSLFVITASDKAKDENGKAILRATRKYITLGERRNEKIAISNGLLAGEKVVTSGQLKLQDNIRVFINNSVKLKATKHHEIH